MIYRPVWTGKNSLQNTSSGQWTVSFAPNSFSFCLSFSYFLHFSVGYCFGQLLCFVPIAVLFNCSIVLLDVFFLDTFPPFSVSSLRRRRGWLTLPFRCFSAVLHSFLPVLGKCYVVTLPPTFSLHCISFPFQRSLFTRILTVLWRCLNSVSTVSKDSSMYLIVIFIGDSQISLSFR